MNPKFQIFRLAFAALCSTLVSLASASAFAKDVSCKGINLIDEMRTKQPELVSKIEQAAGSQPYGRGVLWQVSKPGTEPSFLFGTMHMADPRLIKLPENAEAAFNRSGTLALEITEILDPQKMAGQAFNLMKYTNYLDGSTLSQRLIPDQKAMLEKRLADHAGLPWIVVDKMKPWVAMGMIALPACELARKQAGKPFLDMSLGLRARQQGKSIAALETMQGQMAAMDSLPEKIMIDALLDTAKLEGQLDNIFETMIQLYLKGEMGMIWAMMSHLGPQGVEQTENASYYAEFQQVIVDERNITMADESAKLIDKGGAFIAVGALHLPGEKGLLNILAQRGYTISVQ